MMFKSYLHHDRKTCRKHLQYQPFNKPFNNCSFAYQDPLYRRRAADHETSTTHYMSLKLYGDTQRASIMDPLTATGQVRKYIFHLRCTLASYVRTANCKATLFSGKIVTASYNDIVLLD